MADAPIKKIAIIVFKLSFGGVDGSMITLAGEFARRGLSVDIVTIDGDSNASHLPSGVNSVDLNKYGAFDAALKLAKYIAANKPDVMIANGHKSTLAAYLGRKKAKAKTKSRYMPKIAAVIHEDLSRSLQLETHDDELVASMKKLPITYVYPRIDRIIAVSHGVADNAAKFLGIERRYVRVIFDPLDSTRIIEASKEQNKHPWFNDDRKNDPPTIVAVGRLTRSKDYPTLMRAVAKVREKMPVRLAIIGDGGERRRLDKLALELSLSGNIAFLGYQANSHKFVARANLYALSSIFEGFSAGLASAMILGTPPVATKCPSGPEELLAGHKSLMVPVGDADALAEVMLAQLTAEQPDTPKAPIPSIEEAADKYLAAFDPFD